jgi:hypothetical protein
MHEKAAGTQQANAGQLKTGRHSIVYKTAFKPVKNQRLEL